MYRRYIKHACINSRILAKEHLVVWGQVSLRLLGLGASSGPSGLRGDRSQSEVSTGERRGVSLARWTCCWEHTAHIFSALVQEQILKCILWRSDMPMITDL